MRNIPGITRRGRRKILEYKGTISRRCQKRLRVEWQRNCLRNLTERKVAFWVLSPSLMTFFWTNKFGFTLDPLRRHPGTRVEKTSNSLRIVRRNIFTLKQGFLWANHHKIAAQTTPLTIPFRHDRHHFLKRTLVT